MGHIIPSESHADLWVEERRESFYITRRKMGGTWADHGGTASIELLLADIPHLADLLHILYVRNEAPITEAQRKIESRVERVRRNRIEEAREAVGKALQALEGFTPEDIQAVRENYPTVADEFDRVTDILVQRIGAE